MPRLSTPEGYYTANEVKKILNISNAMVRRHAIRGEITYLTISGRKHGFYLKEDVDRIAKNLGIVIPEESHKRNKEGDSIMPETEIYGSIHNHIEDLPDIKIANKGKVSFIWIDTVFINQGDGPISHIMYHPATNASAPALSLYFKGLSDPWRLWSQIVHCSNVGSNVGSNVESIQEYCRKNDINPLTNRQRINNVIHESQTYEALRAWLDDNLKETIMDCLIEASCPQCGTTYRGLARYCGECTKRIQAAESRQYDEMPVEEDESPESSPTQQERTQDFEDIQTGAYDGNNGNDGDELEDHPF